MQTTYTVQMTKEEIALLHMATRTCAEALSDDASAAGYMVDLEDLRERLEEVIDKNGI
jgi:hypothetical protein